MIRLNYHHPGTPPATLLPRIPTDGRRPLITLIQYDAATIFEEEFESYDELMSRFDSSKVNWINIDGLSDTSLLKKIGDRFGIHPLALEDILNTTQRPKIEPFADHLFIISEMIYFEKDLALMVEQVSLFIGKGFVITFQEEQGKDAFGAVRTRLRTGHGYARTRGADYLMYALLDSIVDEFFPVLEAFGDGMEALEEELLESPTRQTLRRLHEIKRLLLQLRRASWPQREVFNALIRDERELITAETRIFIRDCYDHITQIIDIIESYRDLATGLMDVYLSSLGLRTNDIMRVLTAISSIFIPLTFIAGVYGMNFNTNSPWNMPELNWRYGYLYFWGVSLVIGGGALLFIKRKKWL